MSPADSNPDFEWLLVEFLNPYALQTRAGYRLNMKSWSDWCQEVGVDVLLAKQADVEAFLEWLRQRGLQESTIRGRLNTIAKFYAHAERAGAVNMSPATFVKRPSMSRRPSTPRLTRPELLACLEVAGQLGNQEQLLWRLLSIYGLRIGDAVSIDVEDVHVGARVTVKVFISSSREVVNRVMDPITADLVTKVVDDRTSGPLFRMTHGSMAGDPLNTKAASRMIARVAKRAGVTKKVTPQVLRATVIDLELEAGTSISELKKALGLTRTKTVRSYRYAHPRTDPPASPGA
jgi:integrase/recombinase XerD